MEANQDELLRTLMLQLLKINPLEGYRSPSVPAGASTAGVHVRLELEGMVRHMVKQVWMDNAAIAAMTADELRRQMEAINLEDEIRKLVAGALRDVRIRLDSLIQQAVQKLITDSVAAKLEKLPKWVASKIAERIWADVYDVAGGGQDKRKRRRFTSGRAG